MRFRLRHVPPSSRFCPPVIRQIPGIRANPVFPLRSFENPSRRTQIPSAWYQRVMRSPGINTSGLTGRHLSMISRCGRVSAAGLKSNSTRSALPLFVLRIFADDPYDALALDDFALVAHRLYGSSYLHLLLLSMRGPASKRTDPIPCAWHGASRPTQYGKNKELTTYGYACPRLPQTGPAADADTGCHIILHCPVP